MGIGQSSTGLPVGECPTRTIRLVKTLVDKKLDLDEIEPLRYRFHIPSGNYEAKLILVKEGLTKTAKKPYCKWYWEIEKGKESGKQIVSHTSLNTEDYRLQKHVQALAYKLPRGTKKFSVQALVGGKAVLEIGTEKVRSSNNLIDEFSYVKWVLPMIL